MKVRKSLLTHTIFIAPLLVLLSSSFCLCLNPGASAMSVGMSCGLMEEGSRLLEDSNPPICVKAAKISIGDLTVPAKLILAAKLLPQAFTAQVASMNFNPHLPFAPVLSNSPDRAYPTIEIFTLNSTYRL